MIAFHLWSQEKNQDTWGNDLVRILQSPILKQFLL